MYLRSHSFEVSKVDLMNLNLNLYSASHYTIFEDCSESMAGVGKRFGVKRIV